MSTEHIEKHLGNFSDQRLAELQAATENGTLRYWDNCGCLNHYHQGDYYRTRETVPGAKEAEDEFRDLSDTVDRERHILMIGLVQTLIVVRGDAQRRERMLPLIHAEWRRRAQPVPVTFAVPAKQEVVSR